MELRKSVCLLIILVGLSLPREVLAQSQKFVFVEALGGGLLASANFDLRFKNDARDGFGARIGYTNTGFLGTTSGFRHFHLESTTSTEKVVVGCF